jgi:hypothetical protein
MSFLDHIIRCNTFKAEDYVPFVVAGQTAGQVRGEFAARLAALPEVFVVDERQVVLAPSLTDGDSRTRAMRQAAAVLGGQGVLPSPKGEDYDVLTAWGRPSLFRLDRNLVPSFGVRAFGVHVNGVVRSRTGLKLWIGRRAADRGVAPGKLDNMVAGGQPAGLSLTANLIKEAAEEADVPEGLAAQAVPVGVLSYCMENARGLKPDTLFIYDLEVPADFVPRNTDGELSEFRLMPVDEVAERVRTTGDFKFNVNLVIIDFLIRHGLLSPDTEPDYVDLVTGLHR